MEKWWLEEEVVGKSWYVLGTKLCTHKKKVKAWAKLKFGRLEERINHWEEIIEFFEIKEESQMLSEEEKQQKEESFGQWREVTRDNYTYWAQKAQKSGERKGINPPNKDNFTRIW